MKILEVALRQDAAERDTYVRLACNWDERFQREVPGLYDEYRNHGAALDGLGRDAEAEQTLLTLLKLRETSDALNNMGVMRAYQKRDDEAVVCDKRAIALDPSEYLCIENRADSYRRLGKVPESNVAPWQAMDWAMKTLKENPRLGYPQGYVAYIAARLGDRQRAEDEIAQALQLSPGETRVIRNAVLSMKFCEKATKPSKRFLLPVRICCAN